MIHAQLIIDEITLFIESSDRHINPLENASDILRQGGFQIKQEDQEVPESWWHNFPRERELFSAPSNQYMRRYQELVANGIKTELR